MSIDLKTFQSAFYNPNINQVEKVRPLKAMNKIFGELNTVSRVSVFNPNEITTELKNKLGKVQQKVHLRQKRTKNRHKTNKFELLH